MSLSGHREHAPTPHAARPPRDRNAASALAPTPRTVGSGCLSCQSSAGAIPHTLGPARRRRIRRHRHEGLVTTATSVIVALRARPTSSSPASSSRRTPDPRSRITVSRNIRSSVQGSDRRDVLRDHRSRSTPARRSVARLGLHPRRAEFGRINTGARRRRCTASFDAACGTRRNARLRHADRPHHASR